MRKFLLEYEVSDNETEATAKPLWYVVVIKEQKLVRKKDFSHEIMSRVVGPFISRKNAEKHRISRRHCYGDDSVVFCNSSYYSDVKEI